MDSNQIRRQFLDYFETKKHQIVPSAPLLNKEDPTLLFVNSGMSPFKEYFLGFSDPVSKRITDTQKCLRVSGKHNDLEEVGIDTYHHTLFEMLGNWSFGDYFKKEAIEWAWELLTEIYKIPKENLYVTIFEGDATENIDKDNEAAKIWEKYVPKSRILLGNKKDNFWEMGEQGPCGPCSEIHVDIRSEEEKKKTSGADLVNQDHPLVIEIWNLVFIEFNRKSNGSLENLPMKHIDTGMGFERLCMVLQNKKSNYDTDVFMPLINKVEEVSGFKYGQSEEIDIAIRVIVDHVRAVSFTIADGQLPSNNGAGYVIRRILRRAVRYGYTFLNLKQPFVYKLVEVLKNQMGAIFPELVAQYDLVSNVIEKEESSFLSTLQLGLENLNELMKNSKTKVLEGKTVFKLYDTFGFPVDLTALISKEKGFDIDVDGFNKAMKVQKDQSKNASATSQGDWIVIDDSQSEGFVGYDTLQSDINILKYRKIKTKKNQTEYQLIFDKTPFYPEGGGQIGDTGEILSSEGEKITILNTRKENNIILHVCASLPNQLNKPFIAKVDYKKRFDTSCNHTATHLLHEALREVLGTHVAQKGSLVNENYLRFDFSHFSKVDSKTLMGIEEKVNIKINENLKFIEQRNIDINDAIESGAMALFGEKYGDKVRTVRFGNSIELCGGTHVSQTSDIWYFKLISEASVASGIRRIEAITNSAIKKKFLEDSNKINDIKILLKSTKDPLSMIQQLKEENNSLKKEVESLQASQTNTLKNELKNQFQVSGGINYLVSELSISAAQLKQMLFDLEKTKENSLIILFGIQEGKVFLGCSINKDLLKQRNLNASEIVKKVGIHINAKGGGQPFFAMAGGNTPSGIQKGMEEAKALILAL